MNPALAAQMDEVGIILQGLLDYNQLDNLSEPGIRAEPQEYHFARSDLEKGSKKCQSSINWIAKLAEIDQEAAQNNYAGSPSSSQVCQRPP